MGSRWSIQVSVTPTWQIGARHVLQCDIVGDSIALGTGYWLPHCRTDATIGISSPAYAAAHVYRVRLDLVVVSLGSNDGREHTIDALEAVRSRIDARVIWLLPAVGARAAVQAVARRHGDQILDVRPWVGQDGVHPTPDGYRTLAREALAGMENGS